MYGWASSKIIFKSWATKFYSVTYSLLLCEKQVGALGYLEGYVTSSMGLGSI